MYRDKSISTAAKEALQEYDCMNYMVFQGVCVFKWGRLKLIVCFASGFFQKSYARVRKQNTKHEKLRSFYGKLLCVFFCQNKENPMRALTQNIQSILNGLINISQWQWLISICVFNSQKSVNYATGDVTRFCSANHVCEDKKEYGWSRSKLHGTTMDYCCRNNKNTNQCNDEPRDEMPSKASTQNFYVTGILVSFLVVFIFYHI